MVGISLKAIKHLMVNMRNCTLDGAAIHGGLTRVAFGVNTIQVSQNTFYTFGYTDAIYQSGNTNNKFWAYHLGQYGGTGGGVTDNGTFDRDGYSATKTLKFATQAAIGGYLLVGISSTTSDNIKVSITSSDT